MAAGEQCGGDAPCKQMTLLPQEEIDRILSRTKGHFYGPDEYEPMRPYPDRSLRSQAEADEFREIIGGSAELHESHWEDFSKFQDWVRSEYAAKGFVEVEDDFLTQRAENRA